MRFDCNCKTDENLREMISEIHKEDWPGFNWEVGARLWLSNAEETIMVEYQIMREFGRKEFESPEEPDWFTAYLVKEEGDTDCSNEIDTICVGNFETLLELQDAMDEFANDLFA